MERNSQQQLDWQKVKNKPNTAIAALPGLATSTLSLLNAPETKEKVTLHPGRSYADVDWETQLGITALSAAAECGNMENIIALILITVLLL